MVGTSLAFGSVGLELASTAYQNTAAVQPIFRVLGAPYTFCVLPILQLFAGNNFWAYLGIPFLVVPFTYFSVGFLFGYVLPNFKYVLIALGSLTGIGLIIGYAAFFYLL